MSTPARTWVTGSTSATLQGTIVSLQLDRVQASLTLPQATLDAFRDMSASLTAIGDRLGNEIKRMSDGIRFAYRSLPRAVRRGRRTRVTRDRLSPHWPGTEAVTPDHPARVLYKRVARQALLTPTADAQRRMDRALDQCATADDRALAHDLTETVRVSVIEPAGIENLDTDTHHTPERDRDAAPLLTAVMSSRNAPTDAHALCAYLSHTARPLTT